jgi:hypothetical protein
MYKDDLLIPLIKDRTFNWEIFKQDTKALVEGAFGRNQLENHKLNKTKFHSNLFGPIGLSFKDGLSFAIETSTKRFDTKEEMSVWLKSNRPLVYYVGVLPKLEERGIYFMSDVHLSAAERLNNLKPENTRYIVRYFEGIGKLPRWKYHLQWFFGKYNFNLIRPFLYRMFVLNF